MRMWKISRKDLDLSTILLMVGIVLVVAIWLAPMIWGFMAIVRTDLDLFAIDLSIIPRQLVDPWYKAFSLLATYTDYPGYRAIANTMIISSVTTIAVVLLAFPAAYGYVRYPFRGSTIMLFTIAILSLLPTTAYLIPIYDLTKDLGFLNTYHGLILWYVLFRAPLAAWLYVTFLQDLPRDFEDAARIDGLSTIGILRRIVMPISKTSLMAVAVLIFVMTASELPIGLLLNTKALARPAAPMVLAMLPTGSPGGGLQWQRTFALCFAFSIPLLALCVAAQKYFARGLTWGAIKE